MNYDKQISILLKELTYPTGTGGFLPGVSSTEKEDIEAWQSYNVKGAKFASELSYTIAKILDPSGVLTIPDLIYMIKETNQNPSKLNIFFTVLCLISVIPGISYYGKALSGGLKSLNAALIANKFNIIVNFLIGGTIEGLSFVLDKLPENIQLKVLEYLKLSSSYNENDIKEVLDIYNKQP